jgi:hypothetical protein
MLPGADCIARLSKDRMKVMCGMRYLHGLCNHGHIAIIQQFDARDYPALRKYAAPPPGEFEPDPVYIRVVQFPPGWAEGKDGIWYWTQRSQGRLATGQGARYRRPPSRRADTLLGVFKVHGRTLIGAGQFWPSPERYPVLARCRACTRVSQLRADVLEVQPVPDEEQPGKTLLRLDGV